MATPVYVTGNPVLGFQITVDLTAYNSHPEVYVNITRTQQESQDGTEGVLVPGVHSVRGSGKVISKSTSLGMTYINSGIFWDFSGGNIMTVVDFEASFSDTTSYSVTVYDENLATITGSTTLTSGGVDSGNFIYTLPEPGFAIIQDPMLPVARVAGSILSLSEWENQGRKLGSHTVIGRRDPVIISDVASLRTGEIVMADVNSTATKYDNQGPYDHGQVVRRFWLPTTTSAGVVDLWRTGQVLHFRSRSLYTGFSDAYFIVDGISHQRVSGVVGAMSPPIMAHSISFTEVQRPSPILPGTQTVDWDPAEAVPQWQDVKDTYSTWQEVSDTYPTWLDLIQDQSLI